MTDVSPTVISQAIHSALSAMEKVGPKPLLPRVNMTVDEECDLTVTEQEVIDFIVDADINAPAKTATHIRIAEWDAVIESEWTDGTEAGSSERRKRIFDLLKLQTESREKLDAVFPSFAARDVVIAKPGPWDPWYTAERRASDFYWRAYRDVLLAKGWSPEAVANVDASTANVIGRLADPAGPTSYSSRGLVVGYVQSGKTANFTGIIAKGIDAGYRLIIVLTGTIELLRGQTQRRLDMELIGEENILEGRDRIDADAIRGIDYASTGDLDWVEGRFLKHGPVVGERRDIPWIKRLTTLERDYTALRQGLDTLDFRRTGELADQLRPVYDPVNLFGTDVRIAVVKKNKAVLTKLLNDLNNIKADLREIPALIIDDEADQASVNTTNPRNSNAASADEKERSAINKLISQILGKMPRSQYIGYTATPFANVFVEPQDDADIFPRDFIIGLEPSGEYMGGKSFHDLETLPSDEPITAANSNEVAHVRDLHATQQEKEYAELRTALDMFVLTGAIKLWRQFDDPGLKFKHHTMLVHESVKQIEHEDLAAFIRRVWAEAGYRSLETKTRLRELYESDIVPVHEARADWGTRLPDSFDEVMPFVGEAVSKIMLDNNPVVIVNGSKASDYDKMDFLTKDYWRVMVGGAKLSRGFTVEGLTVTYFKRRALAADTFMQMGRWFGYRPGYRDLVRLYIARDVVDGRGKTYDLYDAFTAIIQDEEAFRDQLREFSTVDPESGHPRLRPIDVPPLVYQQLPWLKPTAGNKMYNAELDFEGDGGELKDFPRQADRGDGTANVKHFRAVRPWLEGLGELTQFEYVDDHSANEPKIKLFSARYTIVSAQSVYEAVREFEWTENYSVEPTLRFFKTAMEEGQLDEFVIVVPELAGIEKRVVDDLEVQLLTRARREKPRGGFSGSSFRQRAAIERIAGDIDAPGGPNAAALSTPTRGALLLTFAADPKSLAKEDRDPRRLADPIDVRDVATLFSLAFPYLSAPRGRFGFRVRDNSKNYGEIISAD